jgi:hypothetical protein
LAEGLITWRAAKGPTSGAITASVIKHELSDNVFGRVLPPYGLPATRANLATVRPSTLILGDIGTRITYLCIYKDTSRKLNIYHISHHSIGFVSCDGLKLLGELAVSRVLADGPDHGAAETLATSKAKLEFPGISIVKRHPLAAGFENLNSSFCVQLDVDRFAGR